MSLSTVPHSMDYCTTVTVDLIVLPFDFRGKWMTKAGTFPKNMSTALKQQKNSTVRGIGLNVQYMSALKVLTSLDLFCFLQRGSDEKIHHNLLTSNVTNK